MASHLKALLQALTLITMLVSASFAQTKPHNIVSLSLCSDQLLMLLADKNNIASLSYLVADPEYSFLAENVNGIALNRGQAEEILALNPDLILTSQFSATATVNLLKRLEQDVTILDFPATLEDSYTQIQHVAALIGEDARGANLIAQIKTDTQHILEQLTADQTGKSAVFYSTNGFSHGRGTLRDDFLTKLGLKNLAADIGMNGPGQLSLETLIAAKPQFLLVDSGDNNTNNLAHPMLQHPALKKAFDESQIITLPDVLFQCAGPSQIEAFSLMIEALNKRNRFE